MKTTKPKAVEYFQTEIRRLYKEGHSEQFIAEQIGMSVEEVMSVVRGGNDDRKY